MVIDTAGQGKRVTGPTAGRDGHASTSTTPTSSPYVTLEPTVHGQIPSDANDPADFYGIIAALIAIVVVVVVVRLAFRDRGHRSVGPRDDG